MTFIYPNKPTRIYTPGKLLTALHKPENWIVQCKWDGKRVMIDCTALGAVTFWGREQQAWGPGWGWLKDLPLERPWFLDGELLRDGRIIVWDFAIVGGQRCYKQPYGSRLAALRGILPSPITQDGKQFSLAETLPATEYQQLLDRKGEPGLEGVVWKSLTATDLWGVTSTSTVGSCFKYRF